MLYLSEKTDNWNEGLNPELTSDMHLIYPFHNLYEHTCFSIFDLLWVRDFNVEISVEYDYATYKEYFFNWDVMTKIFFVTLVHTNTTCALFRCISHRKSFVLAMNMPTSNLRFVPPTTS